MQSSSRSEKNAFQECIPRDSFGGCRDGPGCPGNPSRQPLKESLEMHSCKAFLESLQNGSVTSVKRALKSWGRGTIPTRLQGGGGFEETKRPHPSTTAGGRLRRHLPRGSRFCRGRSWRRAFGPRRSCVRRTDRRHGATHTAGVHSRRRAWLRRRRQCATE